LNRKLIRPKLNEVTDRLVEDSRSSNYQPQSNINGQGSRVAKPSNQNGPAHNGVNQNGPRQNGAGKPANPSPGKKAPPQDTNAEIFYYKKQIEAQVPMIIVLQDGEKIPCTIEWYDRHALKVNREGAPNIMLLKHNIKYMYKDPEHL
jgi:sRNA-binding regulator protein Hfq